MPLEHHRLSNVEALADACALTLGRAVRLTQALGRRRDDYALRALLQKKVEGAVTYEFLVVDVECEGVPSRNTVGINYRERLAICVPADEKQLVSVLALRKDFPVLMHQNQGVPGAPASLCLYFESTAAVHRTWTPQNFLRRIQWWLEQSARGELHLADQPVEQLFFLSPYELVLPWNFEALRDDLGKRFIITMRSERQGKTDAGHTLALEAVNKDEAIKSSVPIELTLTPVVHGFVESDPTTLGGLSELLARRGTELLPQLKERLCEGVGELGEPATSDSKSIVILLHIPVCRAPGEAPTKVSHRAFVMQIGRLALGLATGALTKLQGIYYREVGFMGAQPAEAWRELELYSMGVLVANDAAASRHQSGVTEEGPAAVLVGAGSLGSAMLNIWSRAGWGTWTVIDKDHVKPHNLSRHVAYSAQIGQSKAEVVAVLHQAVMAGATEITPLSADAYLLDEPAVAKALASSQLVIDASTTLEYPRAASSVDSLPRHVSVFVTPNGDAGVLLAEDKDRTTRLRTLEAQYYRALIQCDWAADHLAGATSSFWSGAGCRDVSVVMPYSKVLNQASTLAEQIQIVSSSEDSSIRVWQRQPKRGTVTLHEVPVMVERGQRLGGYDLFFDDGLEVQLRVFRDACLPSETGGVLLGYYDFNINAAVIVAALPAPPDSQGDEASFKRGVAGLKKAVAQASARTAGVVGYIGEWHSHPPGHSAKPSCADLLQLAQMSLGMSDDGLPAIQLIVGEHDIQVLQGVAA